jgi:hypothetical protein
VIDESLLRADLARLLERTEKNIRARCDESPEVNRPLEERYNAARSVGRTGATFQAWREGEITQAAVAWLLSCVFIRFLEDNDFLGAVFLSGPGDHLKGAQDRRTVWYRTHPRGNDREYLLDIFSEVEHLPGLKGLLDRAHNPLWSLGPDGDGAEAILDFFKDVDHDTGRLVHDFTDTTHSTRFLGDLYQNISGSARKQYALLQTPDFVVDFILDRTLTPALDQFPLEGFRLIDPACGSGHFLLAAFDRMFQQWGKREGDPVMIAEKALQCIYGVDLNPYAAAIARFRLLVAALQASGVKRLKHAPDWPIHVVTGDSLLFGPNKLVPSLACNLSTEDPEELRVTLQTQGYHVVVGNPPYINVQDPELRTRYRRYYRSCSGSYQLSVPFTELFFDLAERNGHIGTITSNAFMKRRFGRKFIEQLIPKWDLNHVIDTAGVYLPGHGTPTTIILARNRSPVSTLIRVARGIRGEIAVPDDPRSAPVWSEIRNHIDEAGFEGRYVSISDAPRESFRRYPWSIGGGGAAELKERLDEAGETSLSALRADLGYGAVTREDEVYAIGLGAARRAHIPLAHTRTLVEGENVRDWSIHSAQVALWPYGVSEIEMVERFLWPWRTQLCTRVAYGETQLQRGLRWFEYSMYFARRFQTKLSITLAFVATHNHFVLESGDGIFNRSAPIIKLGEDATETHHLGLLGILNSSAAGFWLRQVCFPKGGDHVGGEGARIRKQFWDERFEYDSAKVLQVPIPHTCPLELAAAIRLVVQERMAVLPAALTTRGVPTRAALEAARCRAEALLLRMIALQEELDWQVYHLYGLLDESITVPIDQIPQVRLGERAFEIVMARAIESGELQTEWFTRHKSTPRTTIPEEWPQPYRALVQRRLDVIAKDRDIALIEQPEYKRRWNLPSWEELEEQALRDWLLDRLEDPRYWPTNPPALTSVARLADAVRHDYEFLQVAEIYQKRADFDVTELVEELVTTESVPFLPVLRYKETGLRKRADWESTWTLQRREAAGEKVEIPIPRKYERSDFLPGDYWRLRGKLDVPKERWISYPHLERDADRSLVIGWAGYDHGQQALALASYCVAMRSEEGWRAERLVPVLAGLRELQPWLDQWHHEPDPQNQMRINESIRAFCEAELNQLEVSDEKVRDWRPVARPRGSRKRSKR